ncbi:MAG: hypothetical protein LBR25_09220 [Erysipelotrichaceae bacterium]|jgi:hypothetical protein|nr:hypothetical protein [Erysipelotrichaceae bacterium]
MKKLYRISTLLYVSALVIIVIINGWRPDKMISVSIGSKTWSQQLFLVLSLFYAAMLVFYLGAIANRYKSLLFKLVTLFVSGCLVVMALCPATRLDNPKTTIHIYASFLLTLAILFLYLLYHLKAKKRNFCSAFSLITILCIIAYALDRFWPWCFFYEILYLGSFILEADGWYP